MKHTMKKLLCMALAIMLLVSAVPVFAMADGATATVNVQVIVNDAGVGTFTLANRGAINFKNPSEIYGKYYTVESGKKVANVSVWSYGANANVSGLYLTDLTAYTNSEGNADFCMMVTVVDDPEPTTEPTTAPTTEPTTAPTTEPTTAPTTAPTTEPTTTEPEFDPITVTIKIGTTVKVDAKPYTMTKSSVSVNKLIKNWNSDWADDYYLVNYKVGKTTGTDSSDPIYDGQTVTINLAKREKDALHDKLSSLKPVVLHVYLNNNFNAEDAHYTITSIAEDGTLDLNNDVKNFLKNYYTAKTSDGITYDGMYVADGYFGVKYLADEKYVVLGNDADETGNTTLDYMRSEGYVHLNVMLTNAKAKSTSSSTADSSNPKTGDTIFVPVMVMGLTASALAAAYVFGKKRFAR